MIDLINKKKDEFESGLFNNVWKYFILFKIFGT